MISELNIGLDKTVKLEKLNLLVGPNNSGKTQTLVDIRTNITRDRNNKPVILKDLKLIKPERFVSSFSRLNIQRKDGQSNFLVKGVSWNLKGQTEATINLNSLRIQHKTSNSGSYLVNSNIGPFLIGYLDASTRLDLVRTVNAYNLRTESPSNVLHRLFIDLEAQSVLSKIFKETFGLEIFLDTSASTQWTLRIGSNFGNPPTDPIKKAEYYSKFPSIDSQGHGYKSFVSIILSVLLVQNRVILIDEPELFLHPAQSKALGEWLGAITNNSTGQIIISTHDSNFLEGIASTANGVNILRLNRIGDETSFTRLKSDSVNSISKNPLLSTQRVLDSIFHKNVIVCEADSDRSFFLACLRKIGSNTNFTIVHAHNKQTISRILVLLKELSISAISIVDLDIINDSEFEKLIELHTDSTDTLAKALDLREQVINYVLSEPESSLLVKSKIQLGKLIRELDLARHSLSGIRSAIGRVKDSLSRWSDLKKNGLSIFPPQLETEIAELLIELQDANLFILPTGELESFLDVGPKNSKWIPKALEYIEKNPLPNDLNQFMQNVSSALK